jgi:hypothetical protein
MGDKKPGGFVTQEVIMTFSLFIPSGTIVLREDKARKLYPIELVADAIIDDAVRCSDGSYGYRVGNNTYYTALAPENGKGASLITAPV